jgi:hypothetical protein
MGKAYEITVKELSLFVGIEITRDAFSGFINLAQVAYINSMLDKLNMLECKPATVPFQEGEHLEKGEECSTHLPFRELRGALLFLARTTRPDTAYAVAMFSQFASCYQEKHWQVAKGVFRYLKGTLTTGLS